MWAKWPEEKQEIILKKYDVILTDHSTRREKIVRILRKFNAKNLDAGLVKFNQGVDSFSKSMDQLHKELNSMGGHGDPAKLLGSDERSTSEKIWGNGKDYQGLI